MNKVPLGNICRFEYGKSLPAKTRNQGAVNVYGSNGAVGTNEVGYTVGKTIIVGRKGSIGEIHLSEGACWPIDTTYFIDEQCADCNLEWLAYALKYLNLGSLNKASGVPGLNRDDAYAQLVVLPESEEQQRQIAARLKDQLAEVEKARQAAQAQLTDSRLLRSRMLKEFFAELDAAPKKKLGDYAATTSGSTPSRGNKQYWQQAEIAWVKTGEVAFAPITVTEEAISKAALAECSLSLLPPKTILIAMYGQGKTRGQSAILEISATTNQACFAILPNDTWQPDFLYLWLKSSYQDLRDLSEDRGGNQANLNGALLKALDVPAPSNAEQQRIVARIQVAMSEIDALENSSKAALEDIHRLPNRVLAQAFDQ